MFACPGNRISIMAHGVHFIYLHSSHANTMQQFQSKMRMCLDELTWMRCKGEHENNNKTRYENNAQQNAHSKRSHYPRDMFAIQRDQQKHSHVVDELNSEKGKRTVSNTLLTAQRYRIGYKL